MEVVLILCTQKPINYIHIVTHVLEIQSNPCGDITVEPLYSGHHWGMKFAPYRGAPVALSQGSICSKRVHLGLSKVASI